MASRTNHRRIIFIFTLFVIALVAMIYWAASFRRPPLSEVFPLGEMRVGVDPSYPPFAVITENDLLGLDIDLANAIGDELGIPVRFVLLGFDGLYDALYTNQVDVLISALPIDNARLGRVIYTDPYFNAGLVFVTPQDSRIENIQAIAGHSLAYEYGSLGHSEANLWLRRVLAFDPHPYELQAYALDSVRLNQSDAALVDAIAAGLYRHAHPTWQSNRSQVSDLLFAAAIRHDELARATLINDAIKQLFERGEIQRIIARWL